MRRLLLGLLSVLFATSLAACGDDDSDTAADDTSSAADDSSDDSSSDGSDDGDSSDGDSSDGDSSDGDSSDGDSSDENSGDSSNGTPDIELSGDFCEQANALATDSALAALDFDDPDDVDLMLSLLDQWADEAPGAIEDDIRLLADQLVPLSEAFNEALADPQAEPDPDFEEAMAEYAAAGERLEVFVADTCGVDLSGDDAEG
jgi:hypothetical protein